MGTSVEVEERELEIDEEPPLLNLDRVRWLHTDISTWPVDANLKDVTFDSNANICLNHDRAEAWPSQVVPAAGGVQLYGNPWVFVWNNRDSVWYGATWEWLRPRQICKASSSVEGGHIKQEPYSATSGWSPKKGEILYFMVSGLARTNDRNVQVRSNPVRVVWPF